jgi:hypothetical protein
MATLLARMANSQMAATALSALCKPLVPGLDLHRAGTCDLRDGILRLSCESAAQANKLRQALPRLLAELQRTKMDVNEIRLLVQPTKVPETGVGHTARGDKRMGSASPSISGNTPHNDFNSLKIQKFSRRLMTHLTSGPLRDAAENLLKSATGQRGKPSPSDQA